MQLRKNIVLLRGTAYFVLNWLYSKEAHYSFQLFMGRISEALHSSGICFGNQVYTCSTQNCVLG